MKQTHLLFATSNPHKVNEVRAILEPHGVRVIGLNDLDHVPEEPVEDGTTFEANARLKAIYYSKQLRTHCLADDSGLEVDVLNGAPGVYSARYAGIGNSRDERDRANNEKLLKELCDVPEKSRTARFVCVMCLADRDGTILATTHGKYEGVITNSPRGTNGFGYDPLLYLPDRGCTSAELSPDEKNKRSHRGEAARKMAVEIERLHQART